MDTTANDMEHKPLISEDTADEQRNGGNNIYMYFGCLVATLASLSLGINLGISSPIIPDIQNDKQANTPHLDAVQASWFGGLLTLGASAGSLISGYMMQSIGRKKTVIVSSLPIVMGFALIMFAIRTWMLFLGRFITGLGCGSLTVDVPIYIGETAPSNLRGRLISLCFQLGIVLGILLIYGLGIILPWRWLAAAAAVVPLLLLFLSIFIAETPRYYLLKNNKQKARSILQRLRGANANIDQEFEDMKRNISNEVKPATWCEIIREKSLRTPTILMLVLMYAQMFSGADAILFYLKTLLLMAGFSETSQLSAGLLSFAGIRVAMTLILFLLIDVVGRKVLLITSEVVVTLSLITLGLSFFLSTDESFNKSNTQANTEIGDHSKFESNYIWIALASVLVFVAGYSWGLGAVVWVYFGELLPLRARGKVAGLATAFVWLCAFVVTSWFSSMLKTLTPQGTYWFFAANGVVAIVFAIVCLPETKGKTLEEIELHFQS